LQAALQALAGLATVRERDANEVREYLAPKARLTLPEAEKLLPAVHTTWGVMLRGLAADAVPGHVEAGAALLADVLQIMTE
jgi:hypothetical protein